jgi:hypothetical protein
VHALREQLEDAENSSAAIIGFMLNMHTIEKASLLVYAQQEGK